MIYLYAIPVLFLLYRSLRGKRVVVGHHETFTFGFLWYAGLPLALSTIQLPINSEELKYWKAISTLMGPEKLDTLTLWGFLIWCAFIVGCFLGGKPRSDLAVAKALKPLDGPSWRLALYLVGVLALLFGAGWAVIYRHLLFRGYADIYDDVARGPLQGALLYTSVVAAAAFLIRDKVGKGPVRLLGLAVLSLTVLSLSVGTRSMPALVTIMFMVVASRLRGGISRIPLVVGAVIMLVALSALAAWRQQTGSLIFALMTPALEPLFTYISAASYLSFNEIPSVAFPSPLLGGLVNVVPRAIWPEKVAFINSLTENIRIFAPLGALHLFTSLLTNFGWLGSIIAVSFAGAGIERLSHSMRPLAITSYGVITAVLMADIWRNPFSQSLIKNILQGAILLPAVLVIMALALQRRRTAEAA